MTPERCAKTELLSVLGPGSTLVTVNKRLAATLRADHARFTASSGTLVWSTPDILPLTAWLQRCWEEVLLCGAMPAPSRLLSTTQERRLWEQIIRADQDQSPLLEPSGCARQAQGAWRLTREWNISVDEARFRYNVDSEAFLVWVQRFERRCGDGGWLAPAALPEALIDPFRKGAITAPATLVLIGFDELTPGFMALLEAIAETGCGIRWIELDGRATKTHRIACAESRNEALTMARWVRRRLTENPEASIGIVVPELESRREVVTRALDECLIPETLLPGKGHLERPYNVSLGRPLADHPVVRVALRLLALLEPGITLLQAGQLLRSPLLAGWPEEAGARAMLDARLRESGEPKFSLKRIHYHAARQDRAHGCPILAHHIAAWQSQSATLTEPATPSAWAERFSNLLQAIGWCRGRALSSEEFQAVESWRELLSGLAALDAFTTPMNARDAVALIGDLARERTFQAQSATTAVQVMGVLECAGQQFDHLWIMGLHDAAWPRPPSPNPFIPLPLQRALDLPHSSEARELRFARTLTQRLLTSANEVIVSHPLHEGDASLTLSPLIADLDPMIQEALCPEPQPIWQTAIRAAACLETLVDDPAPPVPAGAASGGAGIVKYQAACPFRAFAELRLGARALGEAEIGLDARVRGSLLHRVLENVWERLGDQQTLLGISAPELENLVNEAVGIAISEACRLHPDTLTGRFRTLESARLFEVTMAWLDLERARPPFRVKAREQIFRPRIAGLDIKVVIDRIDALEDGRLVLIDYKTGAVTPRDWFGERPDEPQLPLYATTVSEPIAALAFAQLRAGDMGFKGIASEPDLIPGVDSYEKVRQTRELPAWSEVLGEWREVVTGLACDFAAGNATVDPKDYPKTCAYCPLPTLCRIDELHAGDPGLAVDEDES